PRTVTPRGKASQTTTPQNRKINKYHSVILETGTINTSTGTITITVPLSDLGSPFTGDTLFSVTALTFAYTHANPILADGDATRAFDYVLGKTVLPSNCPLGTTCKVTGGGYIFVDPQQAKGSVSLEVQGDTTGRIDEQGGDREPAGARTI